jgi:hypothetical protein
MVLIVRMAVVNRIFFVGVRSAVVALNSESSGHFEVTVTDLVSLCRRNPILPPERFSYGGMRLEMDQGRGRVHGRQSSESEIMTPI